MFFYLWGFFNQCIKLFSRVSGGVFGLLCEFDCSVINLWNVGVIMVWDLESHSTHSQTIKLSLLVSSALVFVESEKQSLCSYGSSITCIGTVKCQKKKERKDFIRKVKVTIIICSLIWTRWCSLTCQCLTWRDCITEIASHNWIVSVEPADTYYYKP